MRYSLKNTQKGLSLLELMIAMFIGLFLLIGIGSSYLDSRKASVKRDEYSLLQDNGRLALEMMSQTIVHSGYTSFPTGNLIPSSILTNTVSSATCSTGEQSVLAPGILNSNLTIDGAAGASDTIGVIYLGDDNVFTDCAGGPLPAGCRISNTNQNSDTASIYSSFYIDNNRTLQCAGSRSIAAEPIADGIENMQILYGINIDADPEVDRYINQSQIATFIDNIVSVQIAVLVRSTRPVKEQAESIVYSLLDTSFTSPNDRFFACRFFNHD